MTAELTYKATARLQLDLESSPGRPVILVTPGGSSTGGDRRRQAVVRRLEPAEGAETAQEQIGSGDSLAKGRPELFSRVFLRGSLRLSQKL
jgi:hypothetical protein